jgi:hypothetical protein
MFGLAFPVLVGATGLAVDSAAFYDQQSRMQTVADAASLAVAKELHLYRKKIAELEAVARVRVDTLLTESGIAGRPHSTTVDIDPDDNLVEIELAMAADSFLPAEIWGENPIVVSSLARAYGQSKLCVLGLDPSKSDTIKADGAASMTAPQCAVQSNSGDPKGLNVSADSQIVSTVICTSGGASGGEGSFTPAPETDCPALEDPLASRPPPPVGGCDYLDTVIESGNVSISPGVYCGGLRIDKTAQVTAEPGVYTITAGKLEVKGDSRLTGDYVGFFFQDDTATFTFEPNTTIDLSAPRDGPMAGILFYENRLSVLARDFTIKSTNARRLLGTIYLPNGRLKIDADANVADASAYTVIVARQIDVKGANLVVNADYGGTDVPVPDGVGPNSKMVMLDR